MKKTLFSFFTVACILLAGQSFAQMQIGKGTKFVNVGIGVGGYSYFSGSGLGLNAALDVGVVDNITVGGVAGYRSYGDGVSSFDIGVRGSYHFNELANISNDKVDLYAGLGLSYYSLNYGNTYLRSVGISDSYGTTYIPFHAGARYFFSNKIGGFAELGSALATLKIGLTFKL